VLFIHPPVVKPSEPPAGIAKLSGALSSHRIKHSVLDLNLECLLALLSVQTTLSDTWTSRSRNNLTKNISMLRSWRGYKSIDRYKRAVADLHHLFQVHGGVQVKRLSFSDYQHMSLSPMRSNDLLKAFEEYEKNPFYPYFSHRIQTVLEKTGANFVGLSLNYLSQALNAFAIIGFIKNNMPDVKIVLGGSLVTSWMRIKAWKNQFRGIIDHAVSGPGEHQLISILGCSPIQENKQYYPSFHTFPLNEYFAPGPVLPYSSSRGCYWSKCAFCPENAEGSAYSQMPKETIIQEIRALSLGVNPTLIHLVDNAISPAFMEELCSNPLGVSWYGFARLTNHLTRSDFCHALKRSGCVMLKLGLESGSQEILDAMKKGNSLAESSDALKSLKMAGISTYVYLLFGTPWETEREAEETLEFVARHSPYIDFLNVSVFNLPITSTEANRLCTKDFYDGDLSLYADFSHPRGWDRIYVKKFLDKKFKRHPAIQPILRRTPPGFGSNHAPLFAMESRAEEQLKHR